MLGVTLLNLSVFFFPRYGAYSWFKGPGIQGAEDDDEEGPAAAGRRQKAIAAVLEAEGGGPFGRMSRGASIAGEGRTRGISMAGDGRGGGDEEEDTSVATTTAVRDLEFAHISYRQGPRTQI